MAEKPVLLTRAAIAQIQQVVREYSNRNYKNLNEPLKRGRWQGRYIASDSVDTAWATITESGRHDVYQEVTLYRSASPDTFTEATCGDVPFIDMQHTLCDAMEGTHTVLVPAGYKAGEAMLVKFRDCGGDPDHDWGGWVVVAGPRMRCATEIPVEIECCTIEGLKFTLWKTIWFFGGELDDREDPCEV
ncbi:MAG: hypothetical protein O2856_19525 [Planctomycetota bacterium]|nr:hypothetical protein [Planctomycetota bacterium]